MVVDVLLRAASFLIAGILVYQRFLSFPGSSKHIEFGNWAKYVGVALVVLTAIRALRQERITPLYAVHLVVGTIFFITLFGTIYFGKKSRQEIRYLAMHIRFANCTLVFLVLTLFAGISSAVSH